MKILFVHDNAGVCQTLAGVLDRAGHKAHVLTRKQVTKDLRFGSEFVLENTDTYRLIPTFASILTIRDIDVINSNNYASWVAAEASRRLLGKPHVITLHGSDIRNLIQGKILGFKKSLLIETMKLASMILATTPDLIHYSSIIGRDILHLPQPINTQVFNDKAQGNEMLPGDPVVFSPTRLADNKGAMNIIELLAKIVTNYPSSRVYQIMWGNTEYLSLLLKRIPSKNLKLVGKMSRDLLPSWYVSSDIVIGQMELGIVGNIELEAMSCRVPVLVYDRYYDYGYHDRDQGGAWKMANDILSDHAFRKRLVQRGSAIIKEKHDMNVVAKLYLEYLRRVVRKKPRSA